ncbi:MAG: YraN family protein [Flavobacteriaceae bacterium]
MISPLIDFLYLQIQINPNEHNHSWPKREDLAAESYQKQGFTIIKRNYRFGRAEVDIIAQKGDTLAIVEVKWRSNTYFGDPQSFVSKK